MSEMLYIHESEASESSPSLRLVSVGMICPLSFQFTYTQLKYDVLDTEYLIHTVQVHTVN